MTPQLILIDDGVPHRTLDLLTAAAARHALTARVVRASQWAGPAGIPVQAGDLMYRPAVSPAAQYVEQALFQPGLATFYRDADGPFVERGDALPLYAEAGVPTLPTFHCLQRRRQSLETLIEKVGGFPMVAKVPGGEGGVGVIRIDSRAGLFSFVDFALANGHAVQLMPYVPEAVHIRAVVVGDQVVASYRNHIDPDDFRSSPSRDVSDYQLPLSETLRDIAVRATHATGSDLGGVDLLLNAEGQPHVLEVNFPCFHAQAEIVAGAPVSDAMMEYLLHKRRHLMGDLS